MLVLGIDTTGERGSVGVLNESQSLCEIDFSATMKHGEKLVPAIDYAMQLAEADKGQIALIAVATGPGSFTGLRIGIAMAKGLAMALQIPIIGVPSMSVIARMAKFWPGRVWNLLPDRRDWIYAQASQNGQCVAETRVHLFKDWLVQFENNLDEKLLFIGPGAEIHREALESIGGIVASSCLNKISAIEIARLGFERWKAGGDTNISNIEPIYLQPLTADVARPAKTTKTIPSARII